MTETQPVDLCDYLAGDNPAEITDFRSLASIRYHQSQKNNDQITGVQAILFTQTAYLQEIAENLKKILEKL